MSKDIGLTYEPDSGLRCKECDQTLETDGSPQTYWQPEDPSIVFWCDCCDKEWTVEEVRKVCINILNERKA